MKCRKAEKWLMMSLDGRLDAADEAVLEKHLEACPACRKARAEYRSLIALLRDGRDAAPRPRFWERLEPRLREETKLLPLLSWERWSLRAIPIFLALVFMAGAALLFTPQPSVLSQSEALLLENLDPLIESSQIFSSDKSETRNMMLIFASLEDKTPMRRPTP